MTEEVSASAALAIRREQELGYRGPLLVNDPRAGLVVLCRVAADSVIRLAVIPCELADQPPELFPMDDVDIPETATPGEAATVALAALRRILRRGMH
jgi:hypothetical protein